MSALSPRARWVDRVLLSGRAALLLAFVLIAALTGLEFLRSRQTAALDAPLTVVRVARLAGVRADSAFTGLQAAPVSNELWGLAPSGAGRLLIREWILDGTGPGPIAPRASWLIHARLAPAAMLPVPGSTEPALLLAPSAGAHTELQEYTLATQPRRLRAVLTRIPAAPAGTVRQIAPETGTGEPALVVVDTTRDGVVTVMRYAGALGTGARQLDTTVPGRFPPALWRLAVTAGGSGLELDLVTRTATPTHRAVLRVLQASEGFRGQGARATPIPEDEPGVGYAIDSTLGEEPLLVGADARPAIVGTFSLEAGGSP